MKGFSIVWTVLVIVASVVVAKPKEWSESEAIAEAQHDFGRHHIRFYWHGTIAASPVGVPSKYVDFPARYPHADGGIGCIVRDLAFRERQGKYSVAYNKEMLALILKNQ